jgi:tetraacyldisaccharide 4'-kinase
VSNDEHIFPEWFSPAARVASKVYGAVVQTRNARFDRGVGIRSVDRPVISVGNIVAGGTGKSPMVRWVAEWALARNVLPLIALRGYRSHQGKSDEAMEHQTALPNAKIAVGANRFATITAAVDRDPSIGVVILDDGFQHRALARNLDLVLIDATCSRLDGDLLPLGWLREPTKNLSRASGVIVTHAQRRDPALDKKIQLVHGRPVLAWCDHFWDGLDVCAGDGSKIVQANESLRGQRLSVWAGIARPEAFITQLKTFGAEIVHVASLGDHAHYGATAVARLTQAARAAGATAIATTGKDLGKIAGDMNEMNLPLIIPRLRLKFYEGENAFGDLLEKSLPRR